MLKVFFDGRCGLCAKEIAHYRAICQPEEFEWCDIFDSEAQLKELGIEFAQALKMLYAVDESGEVFSGVETFLQIWQRLPKWYWRALGRFIALPGIYHITVWGYAIFAKWRFKHYNYCRFEQD
ncbi:DUF393 domain-containing protein [Thiomicrorhabdus indica]|uniref:thiol-disulfide oxidoreductase DCC family protein n=1 Tax=Thiomicrorhabdus indica TaxID=2267253 RepID=UPI002AA72C22|nr:DUF393 domain-containing protein [Thiomicrorhabdus indica]